MSNYISRKICDNNSSFYYMNRLCRWNRTVIKQNKRKETVGCCTCKSDDPVLDHNAWRPIKNSDLLFPVVMGLLTMVYVPWVSNKGWKPFGCRLIWDWWQIARYFQQCFHKLCYINVIPDSKVHGANMGPIWGRRDPVGSNVGPWTLLSEILYTWNCYKNN